MKKVFLTIGILLLITTVIITSPNVAQLKQAPDLKPHEPIYISTNDDFIKENGVISGSGTKKDPFLIAGWNIKASNSSYGIHIRDADSFFVIRDCKISGSTRVGIWLKNASNGEIKNTTLLNNQHFGIQIDDATTGNALISQNVIKFNKTAGIRLSASKLVKIYGNIIEGNRYGILVLASKINQILGNDIKDNLFGVYLFQDSGGNLIYHNNFIENGARDEEINRWDNGREGNYWSDYRGQDKDEDGIGDTPHKIAGGWNKDNYPLMSPWEPKAGQN